MRAEGDRFGRDLGGQRLATSFSHMNSLEYSQQTFDTTSISSGTRRSS